MTNEEAIKMLNKWGALLPSDADEALDMAIDALQPQTGGDLISIQMAIEHWGRSSGNLTYDQIAELQREIESLPSAEPKTGKWKKISPAIICECSECGRMVMTGDIESYKFCHGCGARMMNGGEEE